MNAAYPASVYLQSNVQPSWIDEKFLISLPLLSRLSRTAHFHSPVQHPTHKTIRISSARIPQLHCEAQRVTEHPLVEAV